MSRPRTDPALIDRARLLRRMGRTFEQIGTTLGVSAGWAHSAAGAVPRRQPRRYDPPATSDPVLAQRIRDLARRGFDVPPSRLDEWATLGQKGFSVAERRDIMRLE